MTCVYCEPKSRMTIRDAEARALGADTGVFADDGILGAVGLGERAVAGDAAPEFFGGIGLGGVGRQVGFATGEGEARTGERDRSKDGFHA